jgi:hypothetical protein
VEDDEAPAGLDVLRVVRPLHEVARIFSGPEKINSGQSVKRDPFRKKICLNYREHLQTLLGLEL